jgi:hypothetical protein
VTADYVYTGQELDPQKLRDQATQLEDATGWRKAPVQLTPNPNPGEGPERVASFVKPEDRFLVYLACIMYGPIPEQIGDAVFYSRLSSVRLGIWTTCQTAYVAFRGTAVGQDKGLQDLLDDLAIATGEKCNLSITAEGRLAIAELYRMGYNDIEVCGHSLGGRAALCVSTLPGVKRTVIINAAAPFVNSDNQGPGSDVVTHYHIFGDLISSHMSNVNNIRIRVGIDQFAKRNNAKLGIETVYMADWFDPYYHSTDRFLNEDYFMYSTPQEEQDSIEAYFFGTARGGLEILSLLTSTIGLPFYDFIKTNICLHVIPGAEKALFCKAEEGWLKKLIDMITNICAFIVGAAIGFVVLGPEGVIMGAKAGYDLSKGNAELFMSLFIPGWQQFSAQVRNQLKDIMTIVQKSQGINIQVATVKAVFTVLDKNVISDLINRKVLTR